MMAQVYMGWQHPKIGPLQPVSHSIWDTKRFALDLITSTIASGAPFALWSPVGAGSAWAVILKVAQAFRTASSKASVDGSESQRKPISA
jgi:hypothetical protein